MSQQTVKNIVLDYFTSREDTEISSVDGRVFVLRCKSDKAIAEFGGRTSLPITFDAQTKQYDADCEYVSANHAFLEVIQNDMERPDNGDVRICEVHVPLSVDDAFGKALPPEMQVVNGTMTSDAATHYVSTCVFYFHISLDADLPLQQVVPVAVTAQGKVIPAVAERLSDEVVPLCSGRPPGCSETVDANGLYAAASEHIQRIVNEDAGNLKSELGTVLADEQARLDADYEREVAGQRNQVVINEAKTRRDQRVDDLKRKLKCSVSIRLESALVVWWPVVEYDLRFAGAKGGEFSLTANRYATLEDRFDRLTCNKCGNKRLFSLCQSGEHLSCHGDCASESGTCKVCRGKKKAECRHCGGKRIAACDCGQQQPWKITAS